MPQNKGPVRKELRDAWVEEADSHPNYAYIVGRLRDSCDQLEANLAALRDAILRESNKASEDALANQSDPVKSEHFQGRHEAMAFLIDDFDEINWPNVRGKAN